LLRENIMGRMCVSDHQSNRFAVYCGAGVYVAAVGLQNNQTVIETGPMSGALCAARREAIAALHVARRAGLRAWLVQHPSRPIGVQFCGVAA
jgi:hypothetical protein